MVRRRREQRSLFEIVLPDGDKLWPEHLRSIDEALDDEELVETIAAALEKRWANSGTRGHAGRGRSAHAGAQASVQLEL